ncbi:MAG: efflux RND transporter periplasmic adaptor subunit [Alteromonadaceae bacterium]|nr:efflux RND transporter periplasmic adaptor subunit [Alteromonadaceae bacterium]
MQIRKWLITLVVAAGIFASLGFIKLSQIQAAIAFGESFPEPSETVTQFTLQPTQYAQQYTASGTILAPQQVVLTAEVSGIIDRINFSSNAQVQSGDVFLQINAAQEVAELNAIKAQIQLANLDVKRAQQLVEQRATGQQQLDRVKAELAVAQAQAQAIKARIAKKQIKIPFNGRLGLHSLEMGQFVDANTALVELVNVEQGLWVDFAIPLNKRDWLKDTIVVTNGSISLPASVFSQSTSINNISRNLPIRAQLQNINEWVPGMIVQVKLQSPNVIDAYDIPNTALRYDALGSYVFVLDTDEDGKLRAKREDVVVLSQGDRHSFIERSLPAGTQIANIGAFKLRNGILVNLAQQGQ